MASSLLKRAIALLAALAAVLLLVRPTPATTWYITPDGMGDAPTIQAAVDSAQAGDTILLGAGTFGEAVTLTSDLTLTSELGPETTIIDAAQVRTRCLATAGFVTNVLIEGLTFTGAAGGYDYDCRGSQALAVRGDLEIRNCKVSDNFCWESSAVYGGGNLRISDTEFVRNSAGSGGFCSGFPDPGCSVACINWGGHLDVVGCTFTQNHSLCWSVLSLESGTARFENCVFDGNGATQYFGYATFNVDGRQGATIELVGNLFLDNEGPLLETSQWNTAPMQILLESNTFARNGSLFETGALPALPGSVIRANIFSGGQNGLSLPADHSGVTVECNNSWGNVVNWPGPDLTGVDGNISEYPRYCSSPVGDFTLAANSPCLPGNHPDGADCGLIGALGPGCGPVSVERESWARIKGRYR